VLAVEHALMRRGLRDLLEAEPGVDVVAEAPDPAAAIRAVEAELPDLLVIDLSMSTGSSLETIRLLRSEVAATQIIVLTMEASHVFAQATLDAGAIGFVLKQVADVELPDAVRRVGAGLRYLSPGLTRLAAPSA
jgi:two-component system, NarL family, response regulator NreC